MGFRPLPIQVDRAMKKRDAASTALGASGWHWILPYLAVILFAVSMLALVWFLQVREGEVERNALTRDVQWAEQTMRLHMAGTEEQLGKLARELAAGTLDTDAFQVSATQYIANNPELVNVVWVAGDAAAYRYLAGFDFRQSPVDEALVKSLHRCQFLEDAQTIVRVVGPGTGKTHLASRCWWPTGRIRTLPRNSAHSTTCACSRSRRRAGPPTTRPFYKVKRPEGVPATQQDRAYTSPIWYTPQGGGIPVNRTRPPGGRRWAIIR